MAIGSGKRFQYFTEQISGAGVGRTRTTWRFWHRPVSPRPNPANKIALPLLEIARVLVRFNHIASFIENANHSVMGAAVELRVAYCVVDRIRPGVPQPTEWQRIGN
jgi:hypothetical protein